MDANELQQRRTECLAEINAASSLDQLQTVMQSVVGRNGWLCAEAKLFRNDRDVARDGRCRGAINQILAAYKARKEALK